MTFSIKDFFSKCDLMENSKSLMENSTFCAVYWFVEHEFLINPFHATGLFLYPLKTRGFLTFSGGIERDQCYDLFFRFGL